ncbi:glucans biosynthesis glucosyltransferase MdoH [Acetobacter thailandicus]|uniref:glucans biosynthesis glucosyltransferase MdoH n=1 Tax=Acetobacter thailandicus TaxID=1502842 RepID=UPI001BA7E9C5|nr:glucans biosynthesis glucosyltransferase MdoH [Acetobacter thailandicus]
MSQQDFSVYIRQFNLPEEEVQNIATSLHSWDDLYNWLNQQTKLPLHPSLNRTPIGTPFIETNWKKNFSERLKSGHKPLKMEKRHAEWSKIVERRRKISMIFSCFITGVLTLIAGKTLTSMNLPYIWRDAYFVIYAVMTYFVCATFIKLVMGTWHASRGPDHNPWHPKHMAQDLRPTTRIAITYPVYHEDAQRVVAGLLATWQSVKRHAPDNAYQYDFFLLSDSRKSEFYVAEQAAVHIAQVSNPDARIYYRWRPSNHNAKLGNVIDFCRRWGSQYDYMVVMDADSVMNGGTIHSMVRMMEGNDRLGILQSNPTPILRESFFGRMQQFAGRLYGSVFSYSLQAMYMGHAQYIGHNAVIRTQPFITHCILPTLSGVAPWGGKPLSHDIIEASLMARAGYEVWFLPELQGSYEEIPANILGFLIRERRWMQGNLQHLRFLFINGLHTIHRETFLNGLMGYLSAPLWAIFLFVSAFSMMSFLKYGFFSVTAFFTIKFSAMMLLFACIIFLFLPRILAIVVNFPKNKAENYGGRSNIILSIFIETLFSSFFAPIIMIFITKFVWQWLKRKSISWGTQQRDDSDLPWSECLKNFGWVSSLGIIFTYLLYTRLNSIPSQKMALISIKSGNYINLSSIFLWFFPILGGFVFSVIIARLTSRTFPFLRKVGIFSIPEEINIPQEIHDLQYWNEHLKAYTPDPENDQDTFRYALQNPFFYIRHRAHTRVRRSISLRLLPKILQRQSLTNNEMRDALRDRECFDALHRMDAATIIMPSSPKM